MYLIIPMFLFLFTLLQLQSAGAFRLPDLTSPISSNFNDFSQSTQSPPNSFFSSHSIASNRKDHSNDLCPNNWFRLNAETCVHLSKSKLNFEQSKNYCKLKFNANRLSLPNEAKQRAIVGYLSLQSQSDQLPNPGHSEAIKAWIGLNRVAQSDGDSVLLWDDELELYNKLPAASRGEACRTNSETHKTVGIDDQFDHLKVYISHDHTKKGLIDLVDHDQASELTVKSEPSSSENTTTSSSNVTISVSQSCNVTQSNVSQAYVNQSNHESQPYNVTAPSSGSPSLSSTNSNASSNGSSSPDEPSTVKSSLSKSTYLTKEHLIVSRAILLFDNRFRINRVDGHFYISSGQTDKWRMAFSPSNRLYTICELPLQRAEQESKCISDWQPLPGESNDDLQCVRFVQLGKPSTANEMKKACKRELQKNVANTRQKSNPLKTPRRVGVLKINIEKQLDNLLKLLELEPTELRNVPWLFQLANRSSFQHHFEHRPLFDSACYQLLPREVAESNDRLKRNEERLVDQEIVSGLNELSKSVRKVASHFIHEFDCGVPAEFAVCSYLIEMGKERSLAIDQDEEVERRTGKKIKMDEDFDGLEKVHRTEVNRVEKQFGNELNGKDLRIEWKEVEKETHLKASVDRQMNGRSQNKIENQQAESSDEISEDSLHFKGRSQLRMADLSWTEGHRDGKLGEYELGDGGSTQSGSRPGNETMKRHHLTFNLVDKLQLTIISLNLLLFVFLCIRLNQKRNANPLQESTSSTHVHFENYDHTLRFGPFDSI